MAQLASANHTQWQLPVPGADLPADRLGISRVLADLLSQRGITTEQEAYDFLAHRWEWQPHHWNWPDLQRATERLVQAIEAHEPMAIYGDYDADGVTATAVLYAFLKSVGADVLCHLPHRLHDGYGLSIPALDRLAEMGRRLVVTVDNGVSAVTEIDHANRIGLEVIVTDHHTPPEVLPQSLAMVNPKCYDAGLSVLAGCGVAWMLCLSLQRALGRGDADALLDIVAMGTVADQVPLKGISRHLVHRGLRLLNQVQRPGVRALLARAARDAGTPLTAQDLGFLIGPRLNAAGRLEHPQVAVDLLLAPDEIEAERLAGQLEELNQRRRLLTEEMTAHAHAVIAETCDLAVDRMLILGSESWHHGIAGIVAARLCEAYQRPVIVCCQDGDVWRGSGRGPAWVDLHALLKANVQLLTRFGGHKQAAGCSFPLANMDALRQAMNRTLRESLADLASQPLPVDRVLPLAQVTPELVEELAALEPTGQTNPIPRFGATNVRVLQANLRGARGDTLIAELSDGVGAFKAVGFSAAEVMPLGERVDIVFTPQFNHFRGQTSLQLMLHAIADTPGEGRAAGVVEPTATGPLLASAPLSVIDRRRAVDTGRAVQAILAEDPAAVVWVPEGEASWSAGMPVVNEVTALPPAQGLVLAGLPRDVGALRQALDLTRAERLYLVPLPPISGDAGEIDRDLMNAAYRRLKELEGWSHTELPQAEWPFPAVLFPVVWQALREAGLVLVQGDRWHRLKPEGPVALDALPAIRGYASARQWRQLVCEAPVQALLDQLAND